LIEILKTEGRKTRRGVRNPAHSDWWKQAAFKALNKLLQEKKWPDEESISDAVFDVVNVEEVGIAKEEFWDLIRSEVLKHNSDVRGRWASDAKKAFQSFEGKNLPNEQIQLLLKEKYSLPINIKKIASKAVKREKPTASDVRFVAFVLNMYSEGKDLRNLDTGEREEDVDEQNPIDFSSLNKNNV